MVRLGVLALVLALASCAEARTYLAALCCSWSSSDASPAAKALTHKHPQHVDMHDKATQARLKQVDATMRPNEGCNARGCYSRLLNQLSKSGRILAEEGYVTLVYGDGALVCSAAVLGASLAAVDPSRPRFALLAGTASTEVRAILSASWRIIDVDHLMPDVADVTGVPMRIFGRKVAVLAAPLSRALFLDADQVLVLGNERRARLQALWAYRPEVEMFATTDGINKPCFNSGLLLFRPSQARASAYAMLLEQAAAHKRGALYFRETLPALRECGGFDQPFINAVYNDSWSLLPLRTWMPYTTGKAMASLGVCWTCLRRIQQKWDSFHFFHGFFPWGGDCGSCVLSGGHCHVERMRKVFGQAGGCYSLFAMQEVFWGQLDLLLPGSVAARCRPRLSSPSTERVCYNNHSLNLRTNRTWVETPRRCGRPSFPSSTFESPIAGLRNVSYDKP